MQALAQHSQSLPYVRESSKHRSDKFHHNPLQRIKTQGLRELEEHATGIIGVKGHTAITRNYYKRPQILIV